MSDQTKNIQVLGFLSLIQPERSGATHSLGVYPSLQEVICDMDIQNWYGQSESRPVKRRDTGGFAF